MKVSDVISEFIASISPHVFGVCGGGAMHLNDSIAHQQGLKWVATHHEQAAAFAAEAYARVSNKIGVVHVTAGPGVTNTMTGVACAWADSLPMMVIAGQVDSSTLKTSEVRQLGISEVNGVALMRSITKYAVCVTNPESILFHLQMAYHHAMNGRRGPVYLEIPLNVQGADIDLDKCTRFVPKKQAAPKLENEVLEVLSLLQSAKRPVLLVGNGVHLAGAEEKFNEFLSIGPRIPILCSWGGADLISSDYPLYVGRPGLIGDRAGNFAIQEADLVIALGTRLSIPQIGHNWKDFAYKATLVMVDIDEAETRKTTLKVDLPIVADVGDFLEEFILQYRSAAPMAGWGEWLLKCRSWRDKHPTILPEYAEVKDGVHSYFFLQELAKHLDDDAIIVTDVGTSFVATMQAMPMTGKQRMFHSPGIAPMGYGLPAAIGACFAAPGRQVVCLTGDGGTMFNLQEMQTIVHHKLPILIVLYSNGGYKTMQVTQGNHFGREAVSSPESDISWPDFVQITEAFGISTASCFHNSTVSSLLNQDIWRKSLPLLVELQLSKSQTISPLVKTKVENGKFVPVQLDDMWPYLAESK